MSIVVATSAYAAELCGLRPYLVRVAVSRLKDRDAAEDIVQDTLATAVAASGRFEGRSTLRTWVTGILLHKVTDAFRAMARAPLQAPLPDAESDGDFDSDGTWRAPVTAWSSPELALDCKRFREALEAELGRLPAAQARAFRLRELEGKEAAEICAAMKISESNLFVLLHRARLGLRRGLDRGWFGNPG